jgi:membrane fusion protein (multidrug efflux system)
VMRISPWLISLALTALPAAAEDQDTAGAESSVLVATMLPRQGKLDQPVTAYGTVQAASNGSLAVSSLHAAQVLRLRIALGQTVAAGEPLLDLSADPAASLAYAQALSDLKLAQGELARTRQMQAEHLATTSQVEQAAKAASDAEATLQARTREGGAKPVETVIAPIAGVVTSVAVSNGDHVQPAATLLDITGANGVTGVLGIAPEERKLVKAGQAVHLIDLDTPAEANDATVASVGGMADTKTGLFTIIVKPAADAALTAGAHLRGTIATEGVSGWVVPRGAVLTDDDGPFVFQVSNSKAARVKVDILASAGDQTVVSGPIDPKKKLVIAGNYQLTDGAAIREQAEATTQADTPSK